MMGNDLAARYVSDRGGVDRCDLYLRLEHLAQDVEMLEDAIGVKLGLIPHENKSDRGAYQAYYSDADQALIGDMFAADIAQFEYVF
jgi:hypothetical protein